MQLYELEGNLRNNVAEYLRADYNGIARIIDGLVRALTDTNGEVQNQAVKWCVIREFVCQSTNTPRSVAPLTNRAPNEIYRPFIDKVTDITTSDNIDLSVPSTALRILVSNLPRATTNGVLTNDIKEAYNAISWVLIPRLVGKVIIPRQNTKASQLPTPGMLEIQKDGSYNADAVDVMIEVVTCFGPMLRPEELNALARTVMAIVESPSANGVAKKRALAGVGSALYHFDDQQLNEFISLLKESFESEHLYPVRRRYLIATVGTLARATPKSFGPYLKVLAPYVLSALSQEELDGETIASDDEGEVDLEVEELREAALVALETLLSSCASDMIPFLDDSVRAALRFLRYDPNVAESEDEDMAGTQDGESDDGETEDGPDDDDEFAELDDDGAFSDVDDLSWKLRRSATKVLYTMVTLSSLSEHALLFETIAPNLISRLSNEREESVKLELISTTTALIKKASNQVKSVEVLAFGTSDDVQQSHSRKRRRQDSSTQFDDPDLHGLLQSRSSPPISPPSPPTGPQAEFVRFIPKIVQALVKLWKNASLSLKQSATIMLRNLAFIRNGALADHLQQIEDPIADALKPTAALMHTSVSATGSSATNASLQVEALKLISTITETNSNTVLIPFVIALIPAVSTTVKDNNFKVAKEALSTIEQFAKALTPPRLSSSNQDYAVHLQKLYDVTLESVTDNNVDAEARHEAITVLGVLLARTSGTKLLDVSLRAKGLGTLSDRLKNETTRLASARAIGQVAVAAAPRDEIGNQWVQEVSLELGSHLRKADRMLRGSCLEAIQYLTLNPVTLTQFDSHTIQGLKALLLPVLLANDLHLLTPALIVFAKLIPVNASIIVDTEFCGALCTLAKSRLEGAALKGLLLVVKVIGEQNMGNDLMQQLLGIGTEGETLVLGRAIGTLIVFSKTDLGVAVPQFMGEVNTGLNSNPPAASLALIVLGEIGFRMGPSSPLDVSVFEKGLSSESDKVRLAAAIALGNASSSNVTKLLPIILEHISASATQDYLLLYTVKEILQHNDSSSKELEAYSLQLWEKLFSVSNTEDNRAVGAECIGRLTLLDPATFVPKLSQRLRSDEANVRGLVISAFRFALTSHSKAYEELLEKEMQPMLTTMLGDADVENRRLAVTTLSAAIQNKPGFVIPHLGQIFPLVIAESYIKPELVKTVSIGPFKHNEDSGIDLRKAAYSSMYQMLDVPAALARVSIPSIYDRIIDGIVDDQDVRTLCLHVIGRLSVLDPAETRRRLSSMAERFRVVLGQKIKENAVKQEIEKVNEANSVVVRATLDLDKAFPSAVLDGSGELVMWRAYFEYVKKDFPVLVRKVQSEGQD